MNQLRPMENFRWKPWTNVGTSTVNPFEIIRISGTTIVNKRVYRQGQQPDDIFSTLYAVNGPKQVKADGYGSCVLAGECLVAYDTGSPANGDGYGPKAGQGTATKNSFGLLTCIDSTDDTNKVMLAKMCLVDKLVGQLAGSLSQGGSATVNIYTGAAGSEAASGFTVTAYDWLMNSGDTAMPVGTKVVILCVNGIWYVTDSNCPLSS